MTERWLREAVAMSGLPPPTSFPRDITWDAGMDLPDVTLVVLKGLTSVSVAHWLREMRIDHPVSDSFRRFRGCMVAIQGHGMLFLDSNDSENDQRFTLAHEVSHFVLDHMMPRARVLKKYGASFMEVIDALRDPTLAEQLALALDQIPIGIQVELMDRDAAGRIQTGSVAQAEWRADRLAFEFLAPADIAYPVLKSGDAESGPSRLAARFGLPMSQAKTYARMLTRRERLDAYSVIDFHQ